MGLKIETIGFILVVSVLFAIPPSASSPLENEKLVALSERFDKLQTKVESLETENEALKIRVDCLEKKNTENEAEIRDQREEIIQLKAKVDAKFEMIQSSGSSHNDFATEFRSSNENIRISSIHRDHGSSSDSSTKAVVPSSCRELALIGHILDGLYLVQNVDTKRIETVFCDFGTSIVQETIGTVDVKTKSVHFYVQRNSSFSKYNAVIPFELARLNDGDAFDLPSGIFTIPVPGIYHFDFSAVEDYSSPSLWIFLQVNGLNVGSAFTEESGPGSSSVVSLSASFRLAAGDTVNLWNYGNGVLHDFLNHYTHFSGWLVEEDLM